MRLHLDIAQQTTLFGAFQQMDGYDVIVPSGDDPAKIVRQPYRLGSARRALVKNSNALRASLTSHEEARVGLVREIWPDLADGQEIRKQDDPVNFARYEAELTRLKGERDEIELLPFPDDVLYEQNEFPLAVIVALDEFGLIDS